MRVQQQLATLGGGGEVRVLRMDDVDTTDLGDAKVLSYDASTEKLKFVDQSGGGGITTDNIRTNTNATFLQNINVSGTTTTGTVSGFTHLIAPFGSTKTITVKVASKTSAHRYNGSGSSNGYKLDDIESPFLTLTPGRTYKFDQADSSNDGHPLRFYLEADKTTAYSTNVTTSGTPGSSGAYTQIVVTDSTPQILHYQCSSHAYMGNSVNCNSNQSDLSSLNASNLSSGTIPDARFPSTLPAVNGSQLTGISAGAGVTGITIKEEGSVVGTASSIKSIDFVGSTITATASGTEATVTVSGGGGGFSQDSDGNLVAGTNAGEDLASGGTYNIFIGEDAGKETTTGDYNIAIGRNACEDATTKHRNIGIGDGALRANTNGMDSVAIGEQAAGNKVTTYYCVSIGAGSMKKYGSNFTWGTVAIGNEAMASADGSYNVAIGHKSLRGANSTSESNVAIGDEALFDIGTGNKNIGIGRYSGASCGSGKENIYIGYNAGNDAHSTGDNCIIIGKDAAASTSSVDNEITLGNSSSATLRCNTQTISSLSDKRDKTDINQLDLGLQFVDSLKPVKFKWQTRDGNGKDGTYEHGFIAQDLQKIQKDNDADYLGLVMDENPERLEASYGKLVPILVKAIQELKQEINQLKETKN